MDRRTERKWDHAASRLDWMMGTGPERRWRPIKERFFARMGEGRILFLAVGTGLDIPSFPPGKNITGIDISSRMLDRARARADAYPGTLNLRQLDVHDLDYPEGSFEQVFTSCTFCSVPHPIAALQTLGRALVHGGELHMFEHTGSRYFPYSVMLDLMTVVSRRLGPDLNRQTVSNVERAGFEIREVRNHFIDVVKTIHAVAP